MSLSTTKRVKLAIKRFCDIILSLFLIIILSPVIIFIYLILFFRLGNPVIFIQKRPGLGGKIFKMYKFRTMTNETDSKGNLLPDEQRLTKFGRFLRSTSLDELPELFNVLKGEMSLVGPRPLLVEYLELYSSEQSRRHEMKPGITGWAQVNGRNNISWEEKFRLDVWYVDNWSLFLDIKILFKTITVVFQRKGISSPSSATMEKFDPKREYTESESEHI